MEAKVFIDEKIQIVKELIQEVETNFKGLNQNELNWKETSEKWSINECLEHLNSYSRYYLPEYEKTTNSGTKASIYEYKSKWFGRKCVQSVDPANMSKKKLKSPKHHNHCNSNINKDTVSEFIHHQNKLIDILEQAKSININKAKVKIEIMKLIKLTLGDMFNFFVTHEQRHIIQAKNVLALAKNDNDC